MKTIRTIVILILLTVISQSANAVSEPFKGDTIRYKFDNMLLEVTSSGFLSNSPEKLQLAEKAEQLQKILSQLSIAEPAKDEHVIIEFRSLNDDLFVENFKDLSLKNKKKDTKQLVVFGDGTIFEKDFGRYCLHLIYREVELKIFVDQLSDLSYFSSEAFSQEAISGTEALTDKVGEVYRKNPVQAWVDLRENEPKVFIQEPAHKSMDMLILSGGIGSGWVKNSFVSDINFKLGLGFSRKGMMKNIYSAEWNMMYDFSDSNENKFFELNHFVSIGWEHNFSNTPMEDKWYGISVGYLVKRNNDFFKENTFKISIKKKINDTISLKPELYFNDFFKNVYPGIRFSVAF